MMMDQKEQTWFASLEQETQIRILWDYARRDIDCFYEFIRSQRKTFGS